MTPNSLVAVLAAAVASVEPSSGDAPDPFRAWIAREHPRLSPELTQRLVEQVSLVQGVEIFDDKLQIVANSGSRVTYDSLATWLVARSLKVGPEQATNNLHQYLTRETFPCYEVRALGGIEVEEKVELGHRISLVPFAHTPESLWKTSLQPRQPALLPTNTPTAVLLRHFEHPRMHFDSDSESHRELQLSLLTTELEDAQLALTLVGPCAPVAFGSWFSPAESVPSGGGSAGFAGHVEVGMTRKLRTDEYEKARDVVGRFLGIAAQTRDWVRVPLSQLNAALRRRTVVDSAINLRVAMEALFLHDLDDDRGELAFRVRLRAARFLGQSTEERNRLFQLFRALYTLGSIAVHTGRLPNLHEGAKTTTLLEGGYSEMAKAIEKVMGEGEVDWTNVTLA